MKTLAMFKVVREGSAINFYIREKVWWCFYRWTIYGCHSCTNSQWAIDVEKAFINFQKDFFKSYQKYN